METNSRNYENPKNVEHIIFLEVLPRLPTKSLLRFKTVAHDWYAFITSVEFSKTHVRHLPSLNSRSILTLDCSLESFNFLDYEDGRIAKNKFDKIHSGSYDSLLSSCNGIAFLATPSDISNIHCRFGFDYVLYNPVLGPGHFVKIPHPAEIRLGENRGNTHSFGFGYVSSTEDYYIVAIDLARGFDVVVNVYSVRSKEWESCTETLMLEEDTLPLQFNSSWYRNFATLIKETLYWGIKQGKEHQFIFGFDLAGRTHSVLSYPKFGGETTEVVVHVSDLGLCYLNDCLGAWGKYNNNKDVVELWTLKLHQEGFENSWSKLYSIDLDPEFSPREFFGLGKAGLLLMYTEDTKIRRVVDLDCDTASPVLENEWNAVNYVPSLESVFAMTSEPNDQ